MMRVLLFVLLAAALAGYAFWIYERVELSVPAARRLAIARACVLAIILMLLFDFRLPAFGEGTNPTRWALLDASLSMNATGPDGTRPWDDASARADELERQGWNVVRFGDGGLRSRSADSGTADGLGSQLAPALQAAAESGARQVRVLSDLRFEDAVAARAALETLPMSVEFEGFGGPVTNEGIGRFLVPDLLQPDGRPVAEVEVHGGTPGDSIAVEIAEEGRPVATVRLPAPSAGLRSTATVELPTPADQGRRRYTARVLSGGGQATDGQAAGGAAADAFPDDDQAVTYTSVGFEEGALVFVSLRPDWEPRYLLPVLEEVTGMSAFGYLRTGPDRYVRLGRTPDRGAPADSAAVRRAMSDAALLVVHGLGAESPGWITSLVARPGRRLILPTDPGGAAAVGVEVAAARPGEWYASPDVPTSPIAGSLAGVPLQGLPPLADVMVPTVRSGQPPLHVQLRGAGSPESAFVLLDRASGRVAVALASGFWRWSMRDAGREPYRRLWSGVAGWLLADERVASAQARPTRWVVPRGDQIEWSLPGDTVAVRIVISDSTDAVLDTMLAGSGAATPALPAGGYRYAVLNTEGDTTSTGRFDVTSSTLEMLPAAAAPEAPVRAALSGAEDALGRPLRTLPWPYLLILLLLCGEWIVRRRSGLR